MTHDPQQPVNWIDPERARTDPRSVFRAPYEVVDFEGLSLEAKREALERWELEAKHDEGAAGELVLEQVRAALRALDRRG